MSIDQETRRPYEAVTVVWLALAVGVGSAMAHWLGRLTGGASGSNAGPAAVVGLLVLAFELAAMIVLAAPGFLLAWRALRRGPRRADGAIALTLVLWTPAWLVVGTSLLDGWRNGQGSSPAVVAASMVIVAAALGPIVWRAREAGTRWFAFLLRGAALTAVAARAFLIPHPLGFLALSGAGWVVAGLSARRPRAGESPWTAGVNALAAVALFLSVATFLDDRGTVLAASVLTSVSAPVGGLLLMFQAPRATRRFGRFIVRGLVGSLAVAELALLPSTLGDVVPALLVGVGLSACWTGVALQCSQTDGRDPRWLRLLTVVGAVAVVIGPMLPVAMLIGVAGLVAGIVLMAQAPKPARRWILFWLRGVIGSIAIVELALALRNSLGDAAVALLAGLALVACWVASASTCSRADRTDPRWLRLLTIAAGIAVVLWPFVRLVVSVVSAGPA